MASLFRFECPPLRDFQKTAVDALRNAVAEGHRCIMLMAPTGAGKTILAMVLIHNALRKGKRVMFVCDRKTNLLESWRLVKGGDELLATPMGCAAAGGRRTDLGLEVLCPASALPAPVGALVERPSLEDLVYLHGRPLDTTSAPRPEEAPCSR